MPVIATVGQSHLGDDKQTQAEPEIIPSISAANWPDNHKGLDARPRFIDGVSKEFCLVDSGSAITAVAPLPDDQVRPELALKDKQVQFVAEFQIRPL